ncbi:D-alanyl-D-alanine carboxypeptidase PBP3 [Streptococcus canis]|uniref:serine-type D-Ala-D-Ala carboxypeptidase n=1 Tax=Streptococcus canis FSL Z3-227 TaxID=482234 RepID=A0AAV3FPT6_STRCB|nr:D-alanyl-D-alanine carboxypeptidase PBP3 [Streptococcus canis]EIQ81166.1 D-alanyl-D-alanine serine-type carboxypeptidase [Streptococcus canis FSL Z3-227]MDV5988758.1 D-alanyl-D-alanine carboxypeptidase PBP3 [Streptococcus canis]MDV5994377.1 D-alanyl-D-alanine carboxypeptidase PBP3 [Streptococcus canis]MDV6001895.1 D-alanyl-D-alanine carboxypeptidase PBP3 [Streptococcus canis]MDV6023084.1 D-alanyl-D-alanine carboxypeptidase PBP3 [Streptococcus canis]
MIKRLFFLLLISLALGTGSVKSDDFSVAAKHAIAVEVDSGKILYEKDANEAVPVASISKLLTTYLVYKHVADGKLKWSDPVTISNYPYELTTNYSISNVPLDARKYTVKELLTALIVTNANSPAIALAEKIGGTEPKFVDKMKKQLRDWGISDAKLVNATGLPNHVLGENSYPKTVAEDENLFSATDLAIVARHLLLEFPDVLKLTSKPSATFAGQTIYSYNYMLKGMPYYREGVDGLFIGYSEKGGASFVATSIENQMRVITVVLNAEHSQGDDLAVFGATTQLLQYLLTTFQKVQLLSKGKEGQIKPLPILDSPHKTVQLVAQKNLSLIKPANSKLKKAFHITKKTDTPTAPLRKGQVLAKATLQDPHLIGKGYLGETPSVNLVAQKNISQSFFLRVWWNHFVRYVNRSL